MKSKNVHIGVDVSKKKLDVYNPIDGSAVSIDNEANGFRKLRDMARKSNAIVCCEPTGGCELEMVLFLQRFGIPVAYCDGYRVRHYALSLGQFSKNDHVDAKMIALFADGTNVRVLDEKDRRQIELKNRWKLYKTLMDMHVILSQKASSEYDRQTKAMLNTESKRLEHKALAVLRKCVELANGDERMAYLLRRFTAIDGVAEKTALAIISELPEIGKVSDAAIAKLAGVAPMDHQSGNTARTKRIFGGRKSVRNALYMSALPAIQHNRILCAYYEGLKARIPNRKAAKWAMVPVMRKLLHLMNRLARDPEFELQESPRIKAA